MLSILLTACHGKRCSFYPLEVALVGFFSLESCYICCLWAGAARHSSGTVCMRNGGWWFTVDFPVPFLHFCPVTHTFSARSFSVFVIIIKGSDSKPTQCRSFHWLQKGLDQVQTIFWISGEICSEILQTSKQLLEAKVKLYISYWNR